MLGNVIDFFLKRDFFLNRYCKLKKKCFDIMAWKVYLEDKLSVIV